MLKKQVLKTAYNLFSQYGIKSVSMDDIARNVGMSKRTLYEYFNDKEEVLVQGIEFTYGKFRSYLEKLMDEGHSALDTILLFYDELMRNPRWYSPRFYEDLRRYPNAQKKMEERRVDFPKQCALLFKKGVNEGDFHPDINFEIIVLLVKSQIKMTMPSMECSIHTIKEIYDTVLFTFLRGICTEKGRLKLERYVRKQTYIEQ